MSLPPKFGFNQHWTVVSAGGSEFKIINRANGLSLDADTGNANGSVMELWADRSNLSQRRKRRTT